MTLHASKLAVFLVLSLSLPPLCAQTPSDRLQTFLRDQVQFSRSEIDLLSQGKAVAKVLPSEKEDVAVFGIVSVHAPADFFVDCFRDIESYKKGTSVLQVKKFSNPLRIEDLQQLTIEQSDLTDLKNCKVGSCAVKLSSQAIERLRTEIDWSAPDAREKATAFARRVLLEYVQRYLEGGSAELSEYSDKSHSVRIADQFNAILKASPYVFDYEPEFYEYLREYPKKKLDNVENFIYWSKEKFGLKPVVSVTHVSIYRRPEMGLTLIASKQIYASHYFEASLGLTVAFEATQNPKPSFYLLYFNRSRSDSLHGGFSGMVRGQVKRRARSGVQENLEKVKRSIETLYNSRS